MRGRTAAVFGGAAFAVLVTAGAGTARAAPPPNPRLAVTFDLDRCPELPRADVLRLAGLELGVPVFDARLAEPRNTQVTFACTDAHVEIVVRDTVTAKQLLRRLDPPNAQPAVVARLVAIGAAELILTSWMELTLTPTSSEEPAPPVLRAARDVVLRRQSSERARGAFLLAVADAFGPFDEIGWGWGGGLRGGWTSAGGWRAGGSKLGGGMDLDAMGGSVNAARGLGTVEVTVWSGALRAFARLEHGRVFADLGGGARFGLARIAGTPGDLTVRGGTVAGPWAAAVGIADVGVRMSHVLVCAGVEAGYVLRSVTGYVDGGAAVSIAGAAMIGSIGLGWSAP